MSRVLGRRVARLEKALLGDGCAVCSRRAIWSIPDEHTELCGGKPGTHRIVCEACGKDWTGSAKALPASVLALI